MKLMTLNSTTFPELAAAIRKKDGTLGKLTPSEMISSVSSIKNRRVKMGVITLAEDSQTLEVPVHGKILNVIGMNVPETVGYMTQVLWMDGLNESMRTQMAIASRITDLSTSPVTETQSAILAVYAEGQVDIKFDTSKTDRLFAAGAAYAWISYDWEDGAVEAVYDVSGSAGDNVQLALVSNGDETYTAYLTGEGATKDFTKGEAKPWSAYVDSLTAIVVGGDITSIGSYLFCRHEAVQSLRFEDSSKILHLGDKAFQGCQFGGEFSFPNLADASMPGTFSHCVKLRGLSLNGNVKSIGTAAFTGCLNLRYVHGLHAVETVASSAFSYTPKLEDTDLSSEACTSIGASAFLLSGAMRYAEPSAWPNTQMGDDAIPAETYSPEQLSRIRGVELPNVAPKEVNAEAMYKYTDIDYCKRGGNPLTIATDGCMALGLYHLFNWYHEAPYTNFRSWWEQELLAKYQPIDGVEKITDHDINDMQRVMARTLGWKEREGFPIDTASDPEAAKRAIARELSAGRALVANMAWYYGGGHSLVILGSNAVTDKLTVLDAVRTSGGRGCVFELSFEQLFGDFESCKVISYDVKGA